MIFHGFDPALMALLTGEEEAFDTPSSASDPWPVIALSLLSLVTAFGLGTVLWLSP